MISIGLLIYVFKPTVVLNSLSCLFGIGIGMVFAVETIRLGLKGILFSLICFLPHYIAYIISFMLTNYWTNDYKNNNSSFLTRKDKLLKLMPQLLLVLALIIVGCLLEAYICPFF